jgi:hypothetical protein
LKRRIPHDQIVELLDLLAGELPRSPLKLLGLERVQTALSIYCYPSVNAGPVKSEGLNDSFRALSTFYL